MSSRHFASADVKTKMDFYSVEVCAFNEVSRETLEDALLVRAAKLANQEAKTAFSLVEAPSSGATGRSCGPICHYRPNGRVLSWRILSIQTK